MIVAWVQNFENLLNTGTKNCRNNTTNTILDEYWTITADN